MAKTSTKKRASGPSKKAAGAATKKRIAKKPAGKSSGRGPAKKKTAARGATKSTGATRAARTTRKKGAKRGPKPLEYTMSEAAQTLQRRLDKSEETLSGLRLRALEALDAAQRASVRARIERNERNTKVAAKARETASALEVRRKAAAEKVREQRVELDARVAGEKAAARREQALARAVAAFSAKFLKEYDRKVALTAGRRGRRKVRKAQ